MKHHRLLLSIIAGAVLGVLFGTFFPEQAVRSGFLGELFLNALKMMVLPLIIASLVVGVTNLGDVRHLGSLGIRTVFYYLVTTAIAVIIGIILVLWIQPGQGFGVFAGDLPEQIRSKEQFSYKDVLMGLIHPNLIQAASEFQILPLIVISIIFGIALTMVGPRARVVVEFFSISNEAIMKIIHGIMYFTPVGIFGLIAHRLGVTGGGDAFVELITQLAKYCGTVILGLILHGVFVLPLLLWIFSRRNPFIYFMNLAKALLTALATASSSATLPLTMECTVDEAKVSNRTASVVLPLGATVNMDGTALYEAVAAIFIAQCYGIAMGFGEQLTIFLTATLAAIGAAGIPEAGLVTMVLVLQSVGLPIEGIGLILAVDWFLDRCRTTVNVWGDAVGAAIIDRFEASGENS